MIPQGPGDGRLEPGDVVVEVNGECCTTFLPLAQCFDTHVGQLVSLRVQRGGEVGLPFVDSSFGGFEGPLHGLGAVSSNGRQA